jgi:16S rRNA (uracil1498-N3)-methyltransferase
MGRLLVAVMRRYWVDADSFKGQEIHFHNETFHHIFDVCRQEIGSKFEVLGKDSSAYFVEVTQVSKKSAVAKILETRKVAELAKPHLVLALSISRFPIMDAVIEKAVEMGIARIQPFYSDFSFVRKSDSISENKMERWKKIIVSATQQCGRGELMTLSAPIDFPQLQKEFNQKPNSKGLFAYEGDATLGIKSYLKQQSQIKNVDEFWAFIGSEGGFSPTEVQSFIKWGLQPVTLGDQVLRVETACITTLAVLKYELGLMGDRGNE